MGVLLGGREGAKGMLPHLPKLLGGGGAWGRGVRKGYVAPPSKVIGGPAPHLPLSPSSYAYVFIYQFNDIYKLIETIFRGKWSVS